MFRLLVEQHVLAQINQLPAKEAQRFKEALKVLAPDPFPDGTDKKIIQGTKNTVYRLRAGGYRFFYIIMEGEQTVKVTEFLTAEQAHRKYGRL